MRVLKLFLVAVACFLLMYAGFKYLERATNTTKYAPYAVGEMTPLTYFGNPEPLQTINALLENGEKITIDATGGKVRLLNLWASWCEPCLREMPALDRLQAKLGSDQFEVIALNEDFEGVPIAREYMDDLNLQHLTLYVEPSMASTTTIAQNRLPTSLVIDKRGKVIAKYLGPREWDSDEAVALFEFLINEE